MQFQLSVQFCVQWSRINRLFTKTASWIYILAELAVSIKKAVLLLLLIECYIS